MGRILHLSDIHFGGENRAAVDAVMDYAVREKFDLTAISGDITQYGRRAEFKSAEQWIKALPGPLILTPGNHDVPVSATIGRLIAPFERYRRAFGPSWTSSHDGPGVSVRTFNSARGLQFRANWSKGAVHPGQARDVVDALSRAPAGALKVAMCHHPLTEVTGGPMTGGVRGGARAAQILAQGGVDLILTGHVHTAFMLVLPLADSKTYTVGAATLSVRERGEPAGFNVIEWEDTCVRIADMAWTGSHFETRKTWSVPRRPSSSET